MEKIKISKSKSNEYGLTKVTINLQEFHPNQLDNLDSNIYGWLDGWTVMKPVPFFLSAPNKKKNLYGRPLHSDCINLGHLSDITFKTTLSISTM
jgi:hypothetical protein